MNESTDLSTEVPEVPPQAAAPEQPINPSLSVALREGGDAVQDDLRQAKEFATHLEAQLVGKSKELMHLKFLLEQTKNHFGHLQDSVAAMRAERHKLANEAMRAQALDMALARVTAERDRLKTELDGVLAGLAADKAEQERQGLRFDKRDHRIAELTFEVMNLRAEAAELRRTRAIPKSVPQPGPSGTPGDRIRIDASDSDGIELIPTEPVPGQRARL